MNKSNFLLGAILFCATAPAHAYDANKGCGISRTDSGYRFEWLGIDAKGRFTDPAGTCTAYLKGFNWGGFFLGDAAGDMKEEDVTFLDRNYRMNFVRITLQSRWWNENVVVPKAKMRYRDWIKLNVDRLAKHGMYVLLVKGPHFYEPPCGGEQKYCPAQSEGKKDVEKHPGDPYWALGQPYMEPPQVNFAIAMWSSLAETFKDSPNVMYDTWNEPLKVEDAFWFDSQLRLIDAIRAKAPKSLIFIEGPKQGGEVCQALQRLGKTFPRKNLVLTAHQYNGFNGISPATQRNCGEPGPVWSDAVKAKLVENALWAHSKGLGFAITEWGGCNNLQQHNDDIISIGREHGVALSYWQSGDCVSSKDGVRVLNENGLRVKEGFSKF
jgi:aryl-phospho-beta-D-glucosidase BglC (GH1 family)